MVAHIEVQKLGLAHTQSTKPSIEQGEGVQV